MHFTVYPFLENSTGVYQAGLLSEEIEGIVEDHKIIVGGTGIDELIYAVSFNLRELGAEFVNVERDISSYDRVFYSPLKEVRPGQIKAIDDFFERFKQGVTSILSR